MQLLWHPCPIPLPLHDVQPEQLRSPEIGPASERSFHSILGPKAVPCWFDLSHRTTLFGVPGESRCGLSQIAIAYPLPATIRVINLATSSDLVSFTTINHSFIEKRPGYFDNALVEAGPPPLLLRDGNYIFFHNRYAEHVLQPTFSLALITSSYTFSCSDNATNPTPDGDFWAYNPGWVILNGSNPSQILQRSAVPLLTPQFGWEQGVAPFMCNVHNVTFLEAAARVPNDPGDVFDVWFGGSDAGASCVALFACGVCRWHC